MAKLNSYMIEFDEDSVMRARNYSSDCVIGGEKQWLIITITYNKCIFFVNDNI